MTLRLGAFADIDPATVPLPIGTEVTTQIDRDDRPQGAYARVSKLDGERVEVTFTDGSRATFLRVEVKPFELGIVPAGSRAATAAWDELHPCIAIETTVGSRTNETAGADRRGVFVLPLPWITGLIAPPFDLISPDGSQRFWEIGKVIRQALRADPNTLEMLFAQPRVIDSIGAPLIAMRNGFLSQEIYGGFGRYAIAQLDRLEHNQRLTDHRRDVFAWLQENPTLGLDETAERLADVAHVEASTRRDSVLRARDYLKQLCKAMFDQGHIVANDWVSLRVAAKHELPELHDPRPTQAYNLVRLLDLAIRWLGGEPADVRSSEALRPSLNAIKSGELAMTEVIELANEMTPKLEAARANSPLPRRPDVAAANRVLREARAEAARRWCSLQQGPWGEQAPEPPEARYSDES